MQTNIWQKSCVLFTSTHVYNGIVSCQIFTNRILPKTRDVLESRRGIRDWKAILCVSRHIPFISSNRFPHKKTDQDQNQSHTRDKVNGHTRIMILLSHRPSLFQACIAVPRHLSALRARPSTSAYQPCPVTLGSNWAFGRKILPARRVSMLNRLSLHGGKSGWEKNVWEKWKSIFFISEHEAFAITPPCIIFRYSDRKGVKNVWALTRVWTHIRSSAANKREPRWSRCILVVTWLSLPYQLKYLY